MRKNNIIFLIVCAMIVLTILPGISAISYVNRTDGFSINPQGANNAVDIWGNGTELWISDVGDKLVYHYWRNGTYIDNFTTWGIGMRGICGNATNFVMVPLDTNAIYITTINGTSVANITNGGYANGQLRTEGIWCNDTNIYSVDYHSSIKKVFNIYQNGTYINNFSTNYNPTSSFMTGIWGNGNNFWISSSNDLGLYYTTNVGSLISNQSIAAITGVTTDIYGLWGNGTDFWIIGSTNSYIYHIAMIDVAPIMNYTSPTASDYANVSQNWIYVNISLDEISLTNITYRLYNNYSSWPASLNTSLLAYYPFEETNGSRGSLVRDNTSRYNGTINGSLSTGIPGIIGNSFYFNQSGMVNLTATPFNFEKNDSFSVSLWAKIGDNTQNSYWIGKSDSNAIGWAFMRSGDTVAVSLVNHWLSPYNRLVVYWYFNNNSITNWGSNATWYHFVFTYNGSLNGNASGANMYINGVLGNKTVSATTDTLTGSIISGANAVIGARNLIEFTSNDTLDEIAVWNRTLNSSEAQQLYNSGVGISYGNGGYTLLNNTTYTSFVTSINFTNLSDGRYSYNVLAYDSLGQSNNTVVKYITLDVNAPQINYTAPTENNTANKSQSNVYINLSLNEPNLQNVTYKLETPVSGAAAYYKFDEPSGTTLIDSADGYNGTLTSGFTLNQTGKVNKAWLALGEASPPNVVVPSRNYTGNFSISFWFQNVAGGDSDAQRFLQWGSGAGAYFVIDLESGHLLNVYDNLGDVWTTTFNPALNNWYHVVYVQANGTEYLYINGTEWAHRNQARNITPTSFMIGSEPTANRNFAGYIDELGIWDKALSKADIRTLYNYSSGAIYNMTKVTYTTNVSSNNFTNISSGYYYYNTTAYDIMNRSNTTETREITLDTIAPVTNTSAYLQPILHYKLNDNASSTTVIDSRNYINGTANKNTSLFSTSGKLNNAFSFNGNDDYFTANVGMDSLTSSFSIALWLYPNNWTNYHRVIEKGANSDWLLFYYNTLRFQDGTQSGNVIEVPGWTGSWAHIVVTFDGTTMKIYKNGTLIDSDTQPVFNITSPTLTVGNYGGSKTYGFNGSMDDLRIYNYALTSDEVAILYNQNNGIETSNISTPSASNNTSVNFIWVLNDTISGIKNTTLYVYNMSNYTFLTNGLVAYFAFEGNANDVFGRYNGTVATGTPTFVNGLIGQSVYLNGASIYNLSNIPSMGNIPAFTINLWTNASFTGNQDVLRKEYTSDVVYSFLGRSGNFMTPMIQTDGSGLTDLRTGVFSDGWKMITESYNGSHFFVYVNGTLVNSTGGLSGNILSSLYEFCLGGRCRTDGGYDTFITGAVDEIGMWNRSLNSTEVLMLYNNGNGLAFNATQSLLINQTTKQSTDLSDIFNGILGIPMTLVDGFYNWFVDVFDFAGNSNLNTIESNNYNLNFDFTDNKQGGMKIVPETNIYLTGAIKIPSCNATKLYLLNSSKGNITSTTFSGDVGTFSTPQLLTAGTVYYVVVDGNGGTYTSKRTTSPAAYPYDSGIISWTAGFFNNADWTYAQSIQSVMISYSSTPVSNRTLLIETTSPQITFGSNTQPTTLNISSTSIFVNTSVSDPYGFNSSFTLYNLTYGPGYNNPNYIIRTLYNQVNFSNNTSYYNWTSIPNGHFAYEVNVSGNSGLTNNSGLRIITLDTARPTLGKQYPSNTTLTAVNTTTFNFNFTSRDTNSGVINVTLSVYNNTSGALINNTTYTASQLMSLYSAQEGNYTGTSWSTTDVSGGDIYGLTVIGDKLYACDFSGGKDVFVYYLNGTYTGTHWDYSAITNYCSGLAYDGTWLWMSSSAVAHGPVYKFYLNGTYAGENYSLNEGGDYNQGLAWDGTYFYDYRAGDDTIRIYYPNWTYTGNYWTGTTGGDAIAGGIAVYGDYLWISYGLYASSISKFYKNNGTKISSFIRATATPYTYALATNGTYFYSANTVTKRIYVYKYLTEELSVPITLPEGRYNWDISAYDYAGNYIDPNDTFLVDTTYPLINFTTPTENNATNFSRDWIYVNVTVNETNEANITFNLYAPLNICYQEFANQSWLTTPSNCFLDYTGGYKESIISGPAMTNGYDGDYDTTVFPTYPTDEDLYINYTKPAGALNTSLWQIKRDYIVNFSNYTIPSSCWNTSNNTKLQFQVHGANGGFNSFFYFYCYNDSGWELVTYGGGSGVNAGRFWEEGMFWYIRNNTESIRVIKSNTYTDNRTYENFTGLSNGLYYYNVTIIDLANNQNTTETRQIKLDTVSPIINQTSPQNGSYTNNTTVNFTWTVNDSIGNTLEGTYKTTWDLTNWSAFLPTGLAIVDTNGTPMMHVCESGLGGAVRHWVYYMNGTYASQLENFQASWCYGLAWDGTWLWEVAEDPETIYQYYPNGTYTGTSYFLPQLTDSGGLGVDSDYFYVLEITASPKKVYLYNKSTGTYTGTSWNTGVTGLGGLTVYNGYVYISTDYNTTVLKYYPNGTYISSFTRNTSNFNSGGFAINSEYLFVGDYADDSVYVYYNNNYITSGIKNTTLYVYGYNITQLWTGLNSGLTYYYKMDNITGTNEILDIIDSNNVTSSTGAVVPGKINYSINYTGSQYGRFTTGPVPSTGAFAVSFWTNIYDAASAHQTIFDARSKRQFFVEASSTNMQAYIGGAGYEVIGSFTAGTWTHWVISYNGTNLTMYKNGVVAYDKAKSIPSTTETPYSWIGQEYDNSFRLTGAIDELAFWNRSLSSAEVTMLYNGSSGIGYNQTGLQIGLINQTTKQSYDLSDIFNTIIGVPITLADGIYNWFVDAFDFAGNYNNTSNKSLTVDTTYPQISYTSNTESNMSNKSRTWIYVDVSLTEPNLANITYKLYNYSNPWNQNLISYYTLNETSGTNTYDSLGRNNGTNNALVNQTGKIDKAYHFDGGTQFVDLGNQPAFNFSTGSNFSFGAWVKFDSLSSSDAFIISKMTTGSQGWGMSTAGGIIRISFAQAWNPGERMYMAYNMTSDCNITSTSNYYYLFVTYNGSGTTSGIKFYVNAVLANGTVGVDDLNGNSIITSANLNLGTRNNGEYFFPGYIDEFSIWNKTLSASEVINLYNLNSGVTYGSLSSNLLNNTTYTSVVTSQNFTGLPNGNYFYNVVATDFINYQNTTETRYITLDTSVPNITASLPTNNTYANNTTINFNWTVNDTVSGIQNTTLYIYSNGSSSIWNHLSNGLTGYWSFNETSGTNAGDIFSNNISLTNPIWSAGKINNSLELNGTGYGTFTTGPIPSTGNFSISFWVNFAPGSHITILDARSTRQVEIYGESSNMVFFTSPSGAKIIGAVNNSNWQHWVIVYNGTNASAYRDGVFVYNESYNIDPTTETPLSHIGEQYDHSFKFTGKIDELAIWNRPLNSSEVTELYNGGNGTYYNSSESRAAMVIYNQTTKQSSDLSSIFNAVIGLPVTLIDGMYIWFVDVLDFAQNYNNTVNRTLTVDTVTPSINITYPINGFNYNTTVSSLNYTYSDIYPGYCRYSATSTSLNSNLTLYYKLNEASGPVIDYSGTKNGTNYGAITGVTGIQNNAYNFTGGGPYINTTQNLSWYSNQSFTFSLWIKPNSITTWDTVFGKGDYNGSYYYEYTLYMDNQLRFFYWSLSGDSIGLSSGYIPPIGQWTHVLITSNGSSAKIYINGTLKATDNAINGNWVRRTDQPLYIGYAYSPVPALNYFNGAVDEFAVWNKSLNDTEITALYNLGIGTTYPMTSASSPVAAGTNFTITPNIGSNTYTLYCNDTASNENSSSITFRMDASAPNVSLISPANNLYTNTTTWNFTANFSEDDGLANATFYLYNQTGAIYNQTTTNLSNVTSATIGTTISSLLDGAYTWFYKVYNLVGTSTNASNRTLTIDTIYPQINYTSSTEVDKANKSQNWIYVGVSINDTNKANVTFRLYNNTTSLPEGTFISSFNTDGATNPNGGTMALVGDQIYAYDFVDGLVYKFYTNGTLNGTISLPYITSDGAGLTYDGTYLWYMKAAPAPGGTIYIYQSYLNGTNTGLNYSFVLSGTAYGSGIVLDSQYFYFPDEADKKIYRYYLNNCTPVDSYSTGVEAFTDGFAIYGDYAYISLGWGTTSYVKKVYKNNGTQVGAFNRTSGNNNVRPMVTNGNYIWMFDYYANQIYKYAGPVGSVTVINNTTYNLTNYPIGNYTGTFWDWSAQGGGVNPNSITLATINGTTMIHAGGTSNHHDVYWPNGTYNNSLANLQATDSYGLTWDGQYFWSGRETSPVVYQYYYNGTYTGFSFNVTSDALYLSGMDVDSNYIYIYGINNSLPGGKIYFYYKNGTFQGTSYQIATGILGGAIKVYNGYLWFSEVTPTTPTLKKLYLNNGTVIATYNRNSNNVNSAGSFIINDTYFFIPDYTDHGVYLYYGPGGNSEINFTGLPNGVYFYNVTTADLVNQQNNTETRQITLDTGYPTVTLINPAVHTHYNYSNITFTYTANDTLTGLVNSTLYIINRLNGTVILNNTTTYALPTFNSSITAYMNLSDADYNWTADAWDFAGNYYQAPIVYITVDTISPDVEIDFPEHGYNYSNITSFNWTITHNLSLLDTCWYSTNNLATNITFNCSANSTITNLTLSQGYNTWAVFANDTTNNLGYDIHIFTYDNVTPLINQISPGNYTNNTNVNFTWTINDSTSGIQNTTIYLYNTTNGTLINQTSKQSYELSNIFNTIIGIPMVLLDGVYSWFVDTFDFAGNYNVTANQTFYINTQVPQVNFSGGISANFSNVSQTWIYVNVSIYDSVNYNLTFVLYNSTNGSIYNQTSYNINTSNVLAYYTLDDNTTSTKVVDGSGNGYTGNASINTNILSTAGKVNLAFKFNGINEYVDLGTNLATALGNTSGFTWCSWVKYNSTNYNDDEHFIDIGDDFRVQQTHVDSDMVQIYLHTTGTTDYVKYNAPGWATDHSWHYMCFVYNNGLTNFYYDGRNQTNGSAIPAYAGNIQFAGVANLARRTAGDLYFNGSLDEVRIYNYSLSEQEVTYLYNNYLYINWTNLPNGHYSYEINITDLTNYTNSSGLINITLDTATPRISKSYPQNTSGTAFVNTSNVTFNFSVNDSTSGIYNLTLFLYNNSSGVLLNNTTITYTELNLSQNILSIPMILVDGVYNWAIASYDFANNYIDPNDTFVVDTTFPLINYTTPTSENSTNASRTWIYVNVTVNETNEANITFSLYNSPTVFSEWCYQETANVSTDCGGLNTGTYAFAGAFFSAFEKTYMIDGNWSTDGVLGTGGVPGYLYVNYSKPLRANASSIYTVNHGHQFGAATHNLSINSSCWNYDNNTLYFQIIGNWSGATYDQLNVSCYNGTGWNIMFSETVIGNNYAFEHLYEEAMYWNSPINITTYTDNRTYINWTGLPNGNYYYNVTVTDLANNKNSTEIRKITLDTVPTSINQTYPSNNSYLLNSTVNFTWTINDSTSGIKNTTFYLYQNNTSFTNFCYQEYSNVSTICGGKNTGLYYSNNSSDWLGGVFSNTFDGNWSTYSEAKVGYNAYLFINYTIPDNALINQTIWQFKAGYHCLSYYPYTCTENGPVNISITSSLCTTTDSTLQLMLQSHDRYNGSTFCGVRFYCKNSTGNWYRLLDYSGAPYCHVYNWYDTIYEEAIFWNVTDYSLINQTSKQSYELTDIFNTVIGLPLTLTNGVYRWFIDTFDFAENYNITQNYTLTIDSADPQYIYFITPTKGNDTYQDANWIVANTTYDTYHLANVTFRLFNYTTGALLNNTTYESFGNLNKSVNWTSLINGKYFYNITATKFTGGNNSTETRLITLDTTNPLINYSSGILSNNSNTTHNWVYVNVTITELNQKSINFTLYNGYILISDVVFPPGLWAYYNNSSLINYGLNYYSYNFTGLPDGNFYYNVTITDQVNRTNTTPIMNITLDSTPPAINVTSPIGVNYAYVNGTIDLNFTVNDAHLNNCWYYYNGTNNSISCTSGVPASTTLSLRGTSVNATNNLLIFYANDTFGNLANQTIYYYYKIFENARYYNSTTFETAGESYTIDVNQTGNASVTATFVYNGVAYSTIKNGTNYGRANFTTSQVIPVGVTNNTFYWNFTYANVTTDHITSNYSNQSVNLTSLFMPCNATSNTTYANITFYDESTPTNALTATINQLTWVYWLADSRVNKTFLFANDSWYNYNYTFCAVPNNRTIYSAITSLYYEHAPIGANDSDYPQRLYTNASVTLTNNSVFNLRLPLLSSLEGHNVQIQVADTNGLAISGVDIVVTRLIGGVETVLGHSQTDASGSVVFFLSASFPHTFYLSKTGCSNITSIITPTQTNYVLTMACTSSVPTYPGNTSLEGIRYWRYPLPGVLTVGGNTSFAYYVDSAVYPIQRAYFTVSHSNGTIVVYNQSEATNEYCNSTICFLTGSYNVQTGDHLKGAYYVDVGTGYILLDGDADWKLLGVYTDAPHVANFFNHLGEAVNSWSDVNNCDNYMTETICEGKGCSWNSSTSSCEIFRDCSQYNALSNITTRENNCLANGCYYEEATDSCYDYAIKNRQEFSRFVLVFLVLAIVLAIFGRISGYDAQNPGVFLLFLTGVALLGSASNGLAGPGYFYYSDLTSFQFLNNWIFFITTLFLSIGYWASTIRRQT